MVSSIDENNFLYIKQNFLIYLLNISNSTFTTSLTLNFLMREFKCAGMTLIWNLLDPTFEIVKETPFIETEAFSIKYLNNFLSSKSKLITQDLSIIFIFFTFAVASTWPWT